MAETIQAGGLRYGLDADTARFDDAMKRAEAGAKRAGEAMAKSFEEASEKSEKAIEETFGERAMRRATQAISGLQTIGAAIGDIWTKGAEEASDAIVGLVEKGKEKTNDFLRDLVAKRSKIAAGLFDVFSGALSGLEDMAIKSGARAAEGFVAANEERLKQYLASGRQQSLDVTRNALVAGGLNPDSDEFKKRMSEAEQAADSFVARLQEKVEAAKVALQKLAGTYEGIGDEVKKLIEQFERAAKASERATEQIGKDAGERARLRFDAAIGDAGVEANSREQKGLDAAKEAFAAAELAREAAQKAHAEEKQRERTIEHIVTSLKRQAEAQLANADALTKTAHARALDRSAAMVTGKGRSNLADDPTVAAAREAAAQDAQAAANIKFNTDLAESIRKQTDAHALQVRTLGAEAGEAARLKFVQDELNKAMKDGVPVTDELRASIDAAAAAVGRSASEAARSQEAWKAFQDIGRTVSSSLESAFGKFIETGKFSFKSMVDSMLQDLARLAFRMALMPVFGGGASGGGLFGALFQGVFGGFRAEGGPLDQGKWYIAGERGPEPVWGGGSGAFATGYGGGREMGGGGQTNITMRIDLAGANGDETIARISAAAARQAAMAAVAQSNATFPARQRQLQMLGT
jgi:hypothetical protein